MTAPGPTLGPCQSWISGADVAACCGVGVGTDTSVLDTVAFEASMALYEISGRLWAGSCTATGRRPARSNCECGWSVASGIPWYWTYSPYGWYWGDECGDRTGGCQPLSRVKLAGYPVTEILEVKIDGVVLDALDEHGNPNYRLDRNRWLTRMDDPVSGQSRMWPGCQNMALNDDQPGTFSVSYAWGSVPPQLGKDAAAALACQLFKECPASAGGAGTGADCDLPLGVTRVTRQGVEIERQLLAVWFDPSKPTGITAVDTFLRAYWMPTRGRRPAVSSPDTPQYAKRVG